MTFREARDVCLEYVQNVPGMTIEGLAELIIKQQEDLGLSDLDLGILFYHLKVLNLAPEKSIDALKAKGYL